MEGKEEEEGGELEGIASLALLPSGSVSGHFLHPASATCLGLFGTGGSFVFSISFAGFWVFTYIDLLNIFFHDLTFFSAYTLYVGLSVVLTSSSL